MQMTTIVGHAILVTVTRTDHHTIVGHAILVTVTRTDHQPFHNNIGCIDYIRFL
jgi:hypothetical protein